MDIYFITFKLLAFYSIIRPDRLKKIGTTSKPYILFKEKKSDLALSASRAADQNKVIKIAPDIQKQRLIEKR